MQQSDHLSDHTTVTINTIKAVAKRIKRNQPGLRLTAAQNMAARGFGFLNFIHAERELTARLKRQRHVYPTALDYYTRAVKADLGGAEVGDPPVIIADGAVLPYVPPARCPERLSDRWGDPLEGGPEEDIPIHDLALLQDMMRDEMSFIVRINGRIGVLYELELVHDQDDFAEDFLADGMDLKPEAEVLAGAGAACLPLVARYPEANLYLTSGGVIFGGRVGVHAFVPMGALDGAVLDHLAHDLFGTVNGEADDTVALTADNGLPPLEMELQSKHPHTTAVLTVRYPEGADLSQLESALAGIQFERQPWAVPPVAGQAEALFTRSGSGLFNSWTAAERKRYLAELADVLATLGLAMPLWRMLDPADLG